MDTQTGTSTSRGSSMVPPSMQASPRRKVTLQKSLLPKHRMPVKATPKKPERPDQLVVTMDSGLKTAIMNKAKKIGIPMTAVTRILLESWVGADAVQAVSSGKV